MIILKSFIYTTINCYVTVRVLILSQLNRHYLHIYNIHYDIFEIHLFSQIIKLELILYIILIYNACITYSYCVDVLKYILLDFVTTRDTTTRIGRYTTGCIIQAFTRYFISFILLLISCIQQLRPAVSGIRYVGIPIQVLLYFITLYS